MSEQSWAFSATFLFGQTVKLKEIAKKLDKIQESHYTESVMEFQSADGCQEQSSFFCVLLYFYGAFPFADKLKTDIF